MARTQTDGKYGSRRCRPISHEATADLRYSESLSEGASPDPWLETQGDRDSKKVFSGHPWPGPREDPRLPPELGLGGRCAKRPNLGPAERCYQLYGLAVLLSTGCAF